MEASGTTGARAEANGNSTRFLLSFVPWLLFAVIARRDTLQAATVVGALSAILVAYPSVAAGNPKILELATVAFFVGFAVVAFATDPPADGTLYRYARAIAAAGLATIAFGSLAISMPFTEQYARDQVPREYWDSPTFKEINRKFTALWGAVFAAMSVSHVIAGAIDTQRAETIFNWVIPIGLVVYTLKYMDKVRGEGGEERAG